MDKDQIKMQIDLHKNIQTHIWTATMITIAGTLTLLQKFNTNINKILFILGIITFFTLFNFYLNKLAIINSLIKKMEDK